MPGFDDRLNMKMDEMASRAPQARETAAPRQQPQAREEESAPVTVKKRKRTRHHRKKGGGRPVGERESGVMDLNRAQDENAEDALLAAMTGETARDAAPEPEPGREAVTEQTPSVDTSLEAEAPEATDTQAPEEPEQARDGEPEQNAYGEPEQPVYEEPEQAPYAVPEQASYEDPEPDRPEEGAYAEPAEEDGYGQDDAPEDGYPWDEGPEAQGTESTYPRDGWPGGQESAYTAEESVGDGAFYDEPAPEEEQTFEGEWHGAAEDGPERAEGAPWDEGGSAPGYRKERPVPDGAAAAAELAILGGDMRNVDEQSRRAAVRLLQDAVERLGGTVSEQMMSEAYDATAQIQQAVIRSNEQCIELQRRRMREADERIKNVDGAAEDLMRAIKDAEECCAALMRAMSGFGAEDTEQN